MKNFYALNPRFATTLITIITLQISACNTGGSTPDSSAFISGNTSASITKNVDPDGDNLLEADGKLDITSSNAEDNIFIASTIDGNYGSLTIDPAGNWNYIAENDQDAIQTLTADETINDDLTVSSLDGTTSTISITIVGSDDSTLGTDGGSTMNDIALSWVAPAERENNAPLTLSEIAGYKIYYGSAQGQYPESVTISDSDAVGYTFTNFSAGAYYFAITTIDTDGRESGYSPELRKII